jgi:methionyl-tRNA synthetase
MASFRNFCDGKGAQTGACFDSFWRAAADDKDGDGSTELYHFIGKDILYFHGLFWPTMLKHAGYRRPTRLFAHGFLTVNGEKMSKSRGTFITAAHFLQSGIRPEALRYYYACKLGDRIEDIDLNLNDFILRVNSDLVGKLANIPSRVSNFVHKLFDGKLDDAAPPSNAKLAEALAAAYEGRRYQQAIRLLMREADGINAAIDAAKPWEMAKQPQQHAALHALCSDALRRFDLLAGYLQPVMPQFAAQVAEFLRRPPYCWQSGQGDDAGIAPLPPLHAIGKFSHLFGRLRKEAVAALVCPTNAEARQASEAPQTPEAPQADIADFAKLDLRVAAVLAAEEVEGSDKLLRLQLDLGNGERRQVFAGIKKHCKAADLAGRRVVCVANLRPRKMRFGVSSGMVLAASVASGDGEELFVLESAAPAGAKVS